ncbi:keratin, type I cytoskeletal 19-like [Mixophyes fleayi]|uniref:keratin, type I cytoskeletal 19-like n=1 Tax=Mixophyes fleayi TaxID=3061075 RepID=UPI003F4DDDED
MSISYSSSKAINGSCHGGHYPKFFSHLSSNNEVGFKKVHQKTSSIAHHGARYKAPSSHGCTKISSSTHSPSDPGHGSEHGAHSHGTVITVSGGHHDSKNTVRLSINEKKALQHLNQRLSSYLNKVHSLEQKNTQLETKICEWYANNTTRTLPDSYQYFSTVMELQNQVSSVTMENARIVLLIDNAQLATDDLRNEYEMEHSIRNNIDADVAGLRIAQRKFKNQKQDLEIQVQCIQEELFRLKRRQEEKVNSLKSQLGERVNVELNAAPFVDLSRALSEIREQYEKLMEKNLRDVENFFLSRSSELNHEVSSGAEQLESFSNELIDLESSMQVLAIELQSELNLKSALEYSLMETENTFGSQLAQLQDLINDIEAQLSQNLSDLERLNYDYRLLMDQKTT